MRKYPTDYRLWALTTGAVLAAIVTAAQYDGPHRRVWGQVFGSGPSPPFRVLWRAIEDAMLHAVCLLIPAAAVGWAMQAVAVLWGVRLSAKPNPEQAPDYDDQPPSPPPAG